MNTNERTKLLQSDFDNILPPSYESTVNTSVGKQPTPSSPEPSAPPLNMMDHFDGYTTFRDEPLPPPPITRNIVPNLTTIPVDQQRPVTEREARDALLQLVNENCCWSIRPAKELIITDLVGKSVTHYSLHTWTESRSTSWECEPYLGNSVDCSLNARDRPPLPWEVHIQKPNPFIELTRYVRVPKTESVKLCFKCQGTGFNKCWNCEGIGSIVCSICQGSGQELNRRHSQRHHHHYRPCCTCNGIGRRPCSTCSSVGKLACFSCQGTGKIKCFIKLTVKWKTHSDTYVDLPAIPEKLISDASGITVFQDQGERVSPIDYSRGGVTSASRNFVEKHSNSWPSEMIQQQKQIVKVVNATEARYFWKNHTDSFYVIGDEMKAYCPEYPNKCFCCAIS